MALPVHGASLLSEDLARVHDVVRIERLLDSAHGIQCAVHLLDQGGFFPLAYPVLAGAGALHFKCPVIEPRNKCLRGSDLVYILAVDQHGDMEIAIADMADDGCNQAGIGGVFLRLADALAEPRNRHAHIG